jgi:predicted DNA-binding protein
VKTYPFRIDEATMKRIDAIARRANLVRVPMAVVVRQAMALGFDEMEHQLRLLDRSKRGAKKVGQKPAQNRGRRRSPGKGRL